jgi:hypothetical protein
MMNPLAFPVLRQGMNLGFRVFTNPHPVMQKYAMKSRQGQNQQLQQKERWRLYFSLERNFWPSMYFPVKRN